MLPDGNGFDILAQLRSRPEFSTLPIVMLTAKAELTDIRNGLALGADGYIAKPYSKNQLVEVISHVLKNKPVLLQSVLC
jgi:DNA-binding response OmpR family regulator